MEKSDSVAEIALGERLTTGIYPASAATDLIQPSLPAEIGTAKTFTRNSALSVSRVLVTTVVALLLPGYLTHRLPVKAYSAWVLLLQMSAYVGYLDFGVQSAVAKYVAEYDARGDLEAASRRASAGLAIMSVAAVLGIVLSAMLAWQVPSLFAAMPPALFPSVRISLILIGISLSLGLLGTVPSAIFLGLQRYGVPTVIVLVNRALYTLVVVIAVLLHGNLVWMGAGVALVNITTSLIQIAAWRRLASHVRLSYAYLNRGVLKEMLSYCSVLGIWSAAMLCVTGLDVTIVGHYDFSQTAFYSIATLPTTFVISIVGAALAPLLPNASALSTHRSPAAMGDLLARLTRYSLVLLALTGLPIMVAGYWPMSLWIGSNYAAHAAAYLRVLILANIIRHIGLPYATMLVATGRQKVAIAGAAAESVINLSCSVWLASRMGAIGVAYGTLLGSFVSVAMHFAVGMHYTYPQFAIRRSKLFVVAVLRPGVIALPSLVLVSRWWRPPPPALGAAMWIAWASSTLLLGWYGGLTRKERNRLLEFTGSRIKKWI